jgi:tetratricopeptide (TPR) repeat protein
VFAEDFYQFRHVVLQRAAYELQPVSSRGLLHRTALQLLEDSGASAAELAAHALAGMPGASETESTALAASRKRHLRRAAEDALAQYRNDECLQFLELLSNANLSLAEEVDNDCRAAEVLYRLGRGADAIPRADRALALALRLAEPRRIARAHAVRGAACIDGARNHEAEAHYRAAIRILRTLDEPRELAGALSRLSSAVWLAGKPEEALPIAAEAVELSGGTLIPPQVNIINILLQLGRLEEAKARLAPLQKVLDAGADAYLTCILANTFGILHSYLGEFDAAAVDYQRVCAAAREAGLLAELARGLSNLGTSHFEKREYTQALARQTEAEALAREIGDSRICWYAMTGQADTSTKIGDIATALERSLAAARVADLASLPQLAMQARVSAGECFLTLHQPADAAEILEAALAVGSGTQAPLQVLRGRAALARARHRLGCGGQADLREAEALFTGIPDHSREEAQKALAAARAEFAGTAEA